MPMDAKYDKLWKDIGFNIFVLRKKQELTQDELAELCDRSLNYIHLIEKGRSCSVNTLADIAAALNVPLAKLFEFNK